MTNRPGVWLRLKNRLDYGLALQEILDRLARIGIVIYPYFLVYSPVVARPQVDFPNRGVRVTLLQAHEAHLIASVTERPRDETTIRELMTRASCIAVIEDDELLAYGWFTRQWIQGPSSAN